MLTITQYYGFHGTGQTGTGRPAVPLSRDKDIFLVPVSLCPGTRARVNVPGQTPLSRDVPGQNQLLFCTLIADNCIFFLIFLLLLPFHRFFFSSCNLPEPSLVCLLIELQAHFCFEWNFLVAEETNCSQEWAYCTHCTHCTAPLLRPQYFQLESFCCKKSPNQEIGLGRFWE